MADSYTTPAPSFGDGAEPSCLLLGEVGVIPAVGDLEKLSLPF